MRGLGLGLGLGGGGQGSSLPSVSGIITGTLPQLQAAIAALVLPPSAGLLLWLRSDVGCTPGATFTWSDQSGGGRNFAQATANNQPTTVPTYSGYPTNKPAVNFNPSVHVQLLTSSWTAQAYPLTTYAVVDLEGTTNGALLTDGVGTPIGCGASSSNLIYTYAGTVLNASGVAASAPAVVCMVENGVSSAIYISNSQIANVSGTNGNGTSFGNVSVAIGAVSATANSITGNLGQLLMYSGAHSAATRKAVMAYLGAWSGLTVS